MLPRLTKLATGCNRIYQNKVVITHLLNRMGQQAGGRGIKTVPRVSATGNGIGLSQKAQGTKPCRGYPLNSGAPLDTPYNHRNCEARQLRVTHGGP